MILQLYDEPLVVELSLLRVCVNVVCSIMCEVVELLAVLIYGVVLLLLVEELCHLGAHEACREVMAIESDAEPAP
jgi:hypothetical protein